jgi:maltodextrin utilization protein YvdJ
MVQGECMMIKDKKFPLNYLVSMSNLQWIFDYRTNFQWWKLAFLFLFINGCLMMPLSFHLSTVTQAPLSLIAPTVNNTVNGNTRLSTGIIEQGELTGAANVKRLVNKNLLIATDPKNDLKISGGRYHQSVEGYKNALIFQKHQLILTDQNGFGFAIAYPKNKSFSLTNYSGGVKALVSELWMNQYKLIYVAFASLLSFAVLLVSNIILMSAMALILWLTKFSRISDIGSLREAAAIIIMSAGWPSIAALCLSLFSFDYSSLIMIQSIGLVLVISLVFWKTHFQENRKIVSPHLTVLGDESK